MEILCFRFGIFVGFSLWLQGITLKTHDVTSLIRSQRLLSFFEVSCPISCSLFLYHRNFSYPHKHNVIQTAEVTTALGWPWDEHELPPLPFLPCLGVPTAPSPHSSAGSEQHLQQKWVFLLLQNCNSDCPSIYSSASVLPYQEGWALLLPPAPGTQGWVLAAAQAPPQHLPLIQTAAGCRALWGIPAAPMAQLHSPACASCSSCLRQPSPPCCCSHSQP